MHCLSEGLPIRQQCLPDMVCQKSCLLRDGYSSSPNKRMNVLSGGQNMLEIKVALFSINQ